MSGALVGIGTFLFRYRNGVFPALMAVAVLCLRPQFPAGNYRADLLLDLAGLAVCLAGQSLRALAVGYVYIKRGGKQQRIWAGRLIQDGLFAHTRNPLYLGNLLIFGGLALIFSTPLSFAAGVPAVLFIYTCIIRAEEQYLRSKFGAEYDEYTARVNRWWPDWRAFPQSVRGMVFRWKRVLSKEYGTLFGWMVAALGLRAWTLHRTSATGYRQQVAILLGLLAPLSVAYLTIRTLKKSGRLPEEDPATVDA